VKKIIWILTGVVLTQTACDLQPKVLSFPDSVGDFISARYPALLADPHAYPEIYNSAATDYGVYASPNLYGTDVGDGYVTYASVDDYSLPPQDASADKGGEIVVAQSDAQTTDDYLTVPMYGKDVATKSGTDYVVVAPGDTLYSLAKKHDMSVDELAKLNNLHAPYELAVGQKLNVKAVKKSDDSDVLVVQKPNAGAHVVTRVDVQEIVVAPGDTLYSLSRKYAIPVNDLAVMNKLSAPFNLTVGQKLRVTDLKAIDNSQPNDVATNKTQVKTVQKKAESAKKISSDPTKKLPTIGARSSSKFSWPVRGKILSNYGAKSNGLFNDGINIASKRGTPIGAAENGVVAYAGNEVKGMGNLIIIQHSDGWMTVYAHMDSMNVRRGARVKVGQQIGTVGETGKVDSPQLHFEIRKGTKAYNPTTYLKK